MVNRQLEYPCHVQLTTEDMLSFNGYLNKERPLVFPEANYIIAVL